MPWRVACKKAHDTASDTTTTLPNEVIMVKCKSHFGAGEVRRIVYVLEPATIVLVSSCKAHGALLAHSPVRMIGS